MKELLRLQAALGAIWPELDSLLGSEAADFEAKLLPLLRALESEPLNPERLNALYTLLESYEALYERLLQEIASGADDFRGTSLAVHATAGRFFKVPVWYATDRNRTKSSLPKEWYGGDRGVALSYGRVEVSIPDTHDKGKLEQPRLLRLQFREDPDKHVVLLSLAELAPAAWQSELSEALGRCPKRDVLLFIHGYNVGFERAAQRAAQFAYDLEFQGACVLYSWPSEGATLKYLVDEDNAQWTIDQFEEVLTTVMTKLGASCVHAVAHSMGSRVLAEGLRRMNTSAWPDDRAALREVVFAAPDINADTFRKFITNFHTCANRFTLYASNGDKALETSQKLHKYPRAGEAGDAIVVTQGLETIDASAVDTALMGHSYFCENRIIIQDLFNLIMKGEGGATPRFGLKSCAVPAGTYWVMGL
jgi:esterase/lipase superfamily enzyme